VVVTTTHGRRARRGIAVLGVLLMVSGLGLAAFLAWEYWGTTWVSERRHHAVVEDLEEGWSSGRAVAEVSAGQATAIVRIPAFGDDYAVPLLEGSSDDVLASGFAHVDNTAEPGADGNFVLAGHRVTHGEPLRDMPSLDPGDIVVVDTATRRLTYVLDTAGDGLEVDDDADWVLAPEPMNPDPAGLRPVPDRALITLLTCADVFHSDRRLVAFGHLVADGPRPS
jgi:sortase A